MITFGSKNKDDERGRKQVKIIKRDKKKEKKWKIPNNKNGK